MDLEQETLAGLAEAARPQVASSSRPASLTSKVAIATIVAGVGLGVWGDVLFQGVGGLGINVLGWMVALFGAVEWMRRWAGLTYAGDGKFLLVPVAIFSVGLAWRDSTMLHALDVVAILFSLALWAGYNLAGHVSRSSTWQYFRACMLSIGNMIGGCAVTVMVDMDRSVAKETPLKRNVTPVIRGLLIAAPLLLVFGSLFANADPVYAHLISRLFSWDLSDVAIRIAWIAGLAWITIGFLRFAMLKNEATPASSQRVGILGRVEVSTVLGMLDLLFLSFVVVQVRYMFGGAALVHATIGMTFADYARAGFFELATASGLLLPVLLGLHWATNQTDAGAVKAFRVLATIQIALLFVVMSSAMLRMHLYETAFGLTEMRLYTVAFMGWLAIVFVWLAASVLRGKTDRFAFGALMAAFGVLFCVHVVNPDGLIAATNTRLAATTHRFDGCYTATLSDDAVPALVDALPGLTPAQQATVAQSVLSSTPPAHIDWRTWNLGKAMAWNVVESHTPALREMLKNTAGNGCYGRGDD